MNLHEDYLRLIQRFPLRPISAEEDYAEAVVIAEEVGGLSRPSAGEEDYLAVLCLLIVQYEDDNCRLDGCSPAEMLQYLLDEHRMSVQSLAEKALVCESSVYLILEGHLAQVTLGELERISAAFNLGPEFFVCVSGGV